jgi:hypothetical protein
LTANRRAQLPRKLIIASIPFSKLSEALFFMFHAVIPIHIVEDVKVWVSHVISMSTPYKQSVESC